MMFNPQLIQGLTNLAPKNVAWETPIRGLYLHCCDQPVQMQSYIQEPSICIVLQGERLICLGEQCHRFFQEQFMFCPVNLPVTMKVPQATPEKPYLSISLKIDVPTVQRVLLQMPSKSAKRCDKQATWGQWALEQEVVEAFSRLLRLLETPQDIAFLAPLIQQEIYYRLLQSEQGDRLRSLAEQGSQTEMIVRAADWIERHLSKAFVVERLAAEHGMSVSGFHHHFKKITGLSPLQYQKHLRLNEAQRLIKQGQIAVSNAAYAVGYESPSQFSREYRRYFGYPPTQELAA